MSALDVSCETCAAPAGERCRTENGKPTSAHARRCFDSASLIVVVRECVCHGWTTAWDEDAYSPTGYSCQHFCAPENPCDMPVSETSHTLRIEGAAASLDPLNHAGRPAEVAAAGESINQMGGADVV